MVSAEGLISDLLKQNLTCICTTTQYDLTSPLGILYNCKHMLNEFLISLLFRQISLPLSTAIWKSRSTLSSAHIGLFTFLKQPMVFLFPMCFLLHDLYTFSFSTQKTLQLTNTNSSIKSQVKGQLPLRCFTLRFTLMQIPHHSLVTHSYLPSQQTLNFVIINSLPSLFFRGPCVFVHTVYTVPCQITIGVQ